ncbi:MAG: M23 family peptidase, partial [Bacteroidetes bacterium]|nr:M23 family peptidase [Bacteroidota bacterium]
MIKAKQKSFLQKLKRKYRLVVLSEESLEERASFSLSRVNVLLVSSLVVLLVSIGVYSLISFTSLREYVPGYADFDTRNEFAVNANKIDSLEQTIDQQYEKNQILANILSGNVEEYSKE